MANAKIETTNGRGYWLMKSEPEALSIEMLKKKRSHYWDGVRNYQARNYMRDDMQVGDSVIFYHSSAEPSGVAGIAKVSRLAYPDFTQWDKKSAYYDPKSSKAEPIWHMVDVAFVEQFPRVITREELAGNVKLHGMKLWTHRRLSIIPLSKGEFTEIVRLARKAVSARKPARK